MLVEQLIESYRNETLGSSLDGDSTSVLEQALHSDDGVLAAVAARTEVLVADLDGDTVGGAVIGPSLQALVLYAIAAGPDAVWGVLRSTMDLQVVAVLEEHRGAGIGTALVHAAIDTARTANARVLYGVFDTERTHLTSFFRGCGLSVNRSGIGLDLSALAEIDTELRIPGSPYTRWFSTPIAR